jgi:hypothetical protein
MSKVGEPAKALRTAKPVAPGRLAHMLLFFCFGEVSTQG